MCLVSSVSTTNTLAELCERIGADWGEIAPSLKLDRRIGPYAYLAPGLGIAGGNLERDLATVQRLAGAHGTDAGVVGLGQPLLRPLFGARDILYSLLQGGVITLTVLAVLGFSLHRGDGAAHARALTFATLIVGVLSLIFINRSWSRGVFAALQSRNAAFWWVVVGALGFLVAVLYVPALQLAFKFTAPGIDDLTICFTAGVASFLLIELRSEEPRLNSSHRT